MLCQNKLSDPYFFIAFLKCSKHNYQLDQVLENFKYSFYFDGITLIARHKRFSDLIILLHCFVWRTIPFNLSELKKGKHNRLRLCKPPILCFRLNDFRSRCIVFKP